MKTIQKRFNPHAIHSINLKYCKSCGCPTTADYCGMCKVFKEELEK